MAYVSPAFLSSRSHNKKQLIFRLPSELLSHVFFLHTDACIHQDGDLISSRNGKERHTYIFPYLYVCHRWFVVAMADPHLWKTINFRLHSIEMCVQMAKRANPLLLDIVLQPRHPHGDRSTDLEENIITAVTPLLHRIRSVSCFLKLETCKRFICQLAESPKEIRHISITSLTQRSFVDTLPIPFIAWESFISLRSLHIGHLDILRNPDNFTHPLPSVTQLTLEGVCSIYKATPSFLGKFPSLTHLCFSAGYPSDIIVFRDDLPTATISLPHLRSFHAGNGFVSLSSFVKLVDRLVLTGQEFTWDVQSKCPNPDSFEEQALMFASLIRILRTTTSFRNLSLSIQKGFVWLKGETDTAHANDDNPPYLSLRIFSQDYLINSIAIALLHELADYPDIHHFACEFQASPINHACPVFTRDWRRFLQSQRSLQTLDVDDAVLIHVIPAFIPDLMSGISDAPLAPAGEPLTPNLSSIFVDLRSEHVEAVQMDRAFALFMQRKAAHPDFKITFTSSNSAKDDLELILSEFDSEMARGLDMHRDSGESIELGTSWTITYH